MNWPLKLGRKGMVKLINTTLMKVFHKEVKIKLENSNNKLLSRMSSALKAVFLREIRVNMIITEIL